MSAIWTARRCCSGSTEWLTAGAGAQHLPGQDDVGLGIWQKLMVYAGEQSRHARHPLYIQLVRRLREEGASGATSLRRRHQPLRRSRASVIARTDHRNRYGSRAKQSRPDDEVDCDNANEAWREACPPNRRPDG